MAYVEKWIIASYVLGKTTRIGVKSVPKKEIILGPLLKFYIFTGDINLLYADKNLTSLEITDDTKLWMIHYLITG